MAESIPESHLDLFEKKTFAHLATLMPDGSPQVTVVWIDYDGEHVLVNSARGRAKDRNMRDDHRVALSIPDPDNPYRYLSIRGAVVEVTEEGADAHIHALAKRYQGRDRYSYRSPNEQRVLFRILPHRVIAAG